MVSKAAVLGFPISHSLSPCLHDYWLEHHGITGKYEAIETPEAELGNTLKRLQDENYRGVNLTIPLKEKAIPLLDAIDETAKMIGAVNTIIFENGKMQGFNTDAYGFIQNLKSSIPDIPKSAFIFGAGGAARAIIAGLIGTGIQSIMICNRNHARAENLAAEISSYRYIKIKTVSWENYQAVLPSYALIINTTSLGMKNQPPFEVDFSYCSPKTIVTDIVYNPLETPFLKSAKQSGLKTIDGLGMLLCQGQKAFEYFFSILPEVTEELRQTILQKI